MNELKIGIAATLIAITSLALWSIATLGTFHEIKKYHETSFAEPGFVAEFTAPNPIQGSSPVLQGGTK